MKGANIKLNNGLDKWEGQYNDNGQEETIGVGKRVKFVVRNRLPEHFMNCVFRKIN